MDPLKDSSFTLPLPPTTSTTSYMFLIMGAGAVWATVSKIDLSNPAREGAVAILAATTVIAVFAGGMDVFGEPNIAPSGKKN